MWPCCLLRPSFLRFVHSYCSSSLGSGLLRAAPLFWFHLFIVSLGLLVAPSMTELPFPSSSQLPPQSWFCSPHFGIKTVLNYCGVVLNLFFVRGTFYNVSSHGASLLVVDYASARKVVPLVLRAGEPVFGRIPLRFGSKTTILGKHGRHRGSGSLWGPLTSL